MRQLSWAALLTGTLAVVVSGPVSSHHSHSMFDHEQEVTIVGTVTEFSFRNPHGFLFVDVEEENGEVVNYWIEMSTIPRMIQRGIGMKTFQPGDTVTVTMHPLTDGRPGGNYTAIVAADGKTYE